MRRRVERAQPSIRQVYGGYPAIMFWPERILERVRAYGLAEIPHHRFYAYGTGLVFLSAAWLSTLSVAFAPIRKGNAMLHKKWMRRNYIVTLGFLFYRLGFTILCTHLHVGYCEAIDIMAWGWWSVPMVVNEFIQRLGRLKIPEVPVPAVSTGTTG